MKFADWGKIPERLRGRKMQLNWLEKLTISFYITTARVKKMKLCYTNDKNGNKIELERLDKLCSHSVAIPMSAPEVHFSREKLPRANIKPYVHTMFVGTNKSWAVAKKIMKKSQNMKIDINKICEWLEYLKNVHPLYKKIKLPSEYKKKYLAEEYKKQIDDIIDSTLVATDPQTHYMERRIGSDYAAAATVENMTEDAFSVDPGEQDFLLVPAMAQPDAESQLLELMYKKMKIDEKYYPDDPFIVKKISDRFSCEFENNPKIISGSFPYLFPLGLDRHKLRGSGTVKKDIVKRWMTFYRDNYKDEQERKNILYKPKEDISEKNAENSENAQKNKKEYYTLNTRICHEKDLIFLLFNQSMRHAASGETSMRFKNAKMAKKFMNLIQRPGFDKELEFCVTHPKHKRANRMYRKLMRFIQLTGKRIGWSPMERRSTIQKLYALSQRFGTGGVFITWAPLPSNNPLTIRLSLRVQGKEQRDFNWDWSKELPNLQDRCKLVADNPVEAARVFDLFCKTLIESVIKISLSKQHGGSDIDHLVNPKKGAFLQPYGLYGIIEAQQRGTLHFHGMLFTEFVADILTKYAHDEESVKKICELIDQQFSATIEGRDDDHEEKTPEPTWHQTYWNVMGKQKEEKNSECKKKSAPSEQEEEKEEEKEKPTYCTNHNIGMHEGPSNFKDMAPYADNVNKKSNFHTHSFTCWKCGNYCRLGVDRPFSRRTVIFELECDENGRIRRRQGPVRPPPALNLAYPLERHGVRTLQTNKTFTKTNKG